MFDKVNNAALEIMSSYLRSECVFENDEAFFEKFIFFKDEWQQEQKRVWSSEADFVRTHFIMILSWFFMNLFEGRNVKNGRALMSSISYQRKI